MWLVGIVSYIICLAFVLKPKILLHKLINNYSNELWLNKRIVKKAMIIGYLILHVIFIYDLKEIISQIRCEKCKLTKVTKTVDATYYELVYAMLS